MIDTGAIFILLILSLISGLSAALLGGLWKGHALVAFSVTFTLDFFLGVWPLGIFAAFLVLLLMGNNRAGRCPVFPPMTRTTMAGSAVFLMDCSNEPDILPARNL